MKTIFLTGRLNAVTKAIYNALSGEYKVQLTSGEPEVVGGMLQVTRPDLILVCTVDMEDDREKILDYISENYKTIPVVVVSSPSEAEEIEKYISLEQFQVLFRPIKTTDILSAIRKQLHMDNPLQCELLKIRYRILSFLTMICQNRMVKKYLRCCRITSRRRTCRWYF